MDLRVPTSIDGEPVAEAVRSHLEAIRDVLNAHGAHRERLKHALLDLVEFLASPSGRTNANCVAVDSVFTYQLGDHPALEDVPDDLGEIMFDLGGALHDTFSAPHVAENFDSTPEQLLRRLRALE